MRHVQSNLRSRHSHIEQSSVQSIRGLGVMAIVSPLFILLFWSVTLEEWQDAIFARWSKNDWPFKTFC